MHWHHEKSVVVTFGAGNPAVSDLYIAWEDGRRFVTGFASTHGTMSRLTSVTIQTTAYIPTEDEPVVVMSLLAEDVKHDPV